MDLGIDFCVAALRWDGLRAEPFDAHPEGTGLLRRAGVDAGGWRAWLTAVVAEHGAVVRSMAAAAAEPSKWMRFVPAPELWRGDAVAGRALAELWPGYLVAASAAKRRNVERLVTLTAGKNWWKELEPYHRRIPPLRVFLVSYPEPVVLALPPDAAILGLGRFEQPVFERQLKQAADGLARG
jgi:hypothetical protein